MTIWFVIKVLHVFGAVMWVGGGITMVLFIAPAVQATAPAGGAVMAHLAGKLKLPAVLNHTAWLTALTGMAMFWRIASGADAVYFQTAPGMGLAIGSVTGMLAFVAAVLVQLPRAKRIAALGAEAGGSPSEAQATELQDEQRKFALGGKIVVGLFVAALLGMLMSHPI